MNLKKQKKTIKLIRCFNYSNIHEISGQIEKLTISYSKKETISLKVFIKIYTFLELITGQRAFFIRSKKSIAALKIRKGMPIGAKVTLRNFFLFSFLFKLVWQVLPNIKTYNIKKKKIGLKKN
jgi:large subunit ribosomal protein L5